MSRRGFVLGAAMVIALGSALFHQRVTQASELLVRTGALPTSAKEQIVGSWQLAEIYQEDDGGKQIDQFGGAPTGIFMADRQGHFSFQIMSNHGRHLLANSPPAVVMARDDGLLEAESYFGVYRVDEQQRKLTLHIEHCLFRGCDQTDRTAEIKVDRNKLESTSAAEPSPTGAFYSYMIWKRECCLQAAAPVSEVRKAVRFSRPKLGK